MASKSAVIIGGGFYGVNIALYLSQYKNIKDIVIFEKEEQLLSRASYVNQARIHNGYHYPRSFTTAYRSRINFPRFVRDWQDAVDNHFTKIYAVAKNSSKVTASQFERFCRQIGAPIEQADTAVSQLFNPKLIEAAFLVKEYAFNSKILAQWAEQALAQHNIPVFFNTDVQRLEKCGEKINVFYQTAAGQLETKATDWVFNCTYSGLNRFFSPQESSQTPLKHEITEMGLLDMPPILKSLGITVMDGPFFSVMPFPSKGFHSLSHVRYTPHFSWTDNALAQNPYQVLTDYNKISRVDRMMRDVERFLPAIADAKYQGSLFEVKTVLMKNETDDGRPILFRKSLELPQAYSVLGGKIDNIYDIFERLENEF